MRIEGPELVAVDLGSWGACAEEIARLWAAGEAVLPLRPSLAEAEKQRLLEAARPAAVVTPEGRMPLDRGRPAEPGTAAVLLTSGSTGAPKAVELSRRALEAAAEATHRRVGAEPNDRWLCCLPMDHVAGFSMIVRAVQLGTEPIILERFDETAVAEAEAELVSFVPTQLVRLLDAGVDLSHFKTILLGGAALPAPLIERAVAAGGPIVRTYGMTETCGGVVYDGVPLDEVQLRIESDGRISISSPTLMTCYRGAPELTEQHLRDGWFLTDDLGNQRGGRLTVTGRADDIIVTGGEKVAPSEVAALLLTHPGVSEAVAFGAPDAEWGSRVVAVVTQRPGAPDISPEELRAFLSERAAAYKVPKQIHVVPDLPRFSSGKVDIPTLRTTLETTSESGRYTSLN